MVKKVFTIVVLILAFTSLKTEADNPKGTEITKTAGEVAATFNDTPVTNKELEDYLHSTLMQIRQKEYEIKFNGLKELIFDKLQFIEAQKKGISLEDYYKQNVTEKVSQPTEEEIKKVLDQYRNRLPHDEDEARKKVIEYLKQQKMQQRDEAFKNELLSKANIKIFLQPPRIEVPLTGHEPVYGPEDAPVTIIEFSEFECPYCGKVQPTLNKLKKEYEGKLKIIFKHLPLEFHKNARHAAVVSLCAKDQKKFWEMHDWLFSNRAKLGNSEEIKNHAKTLGMDIDTFTACVEGKKHDEVIDKDMATAEELGTTATPSFFINGRLLQGAQPYEKFKEVIEQELEFAKDKG